MATAVEFIDHWPQGKLLQLKATFTDDNGALADPTTITFKTKQDTDATYVSHTSDVVRDSQGLYRLPFLPNKSGLWKWRPEGAGAIVDVTEDQLFYVDETVFLP